MGDKYLTWPNLHLIASCISLSGCFGLVFAVCIFGGSARHSPQHCDAVEIKSYRMNNLHFVEDSLMYIMYCIFPCSSCAGGMGTDATTILTKNVVFPLDLWEDDEWDLQKKGTWTQLQEIWNTGQQPESNMITDAYIWHMIDHIGLPLLARTPNALWLFAFNTHE